MRLIAVALSAAVAAATACTGQSGSVGVDDSTFVATMAELHRVDSMRTRDSAQVISARRAVLARHGLTPERLEQAARALADDPERASALWTAINQRLSGPKNKPRSLPGRPGTVPLSKRPRTETSPGIKRARPEIKQTRPDTEQTRPPIKRRGNDTSRSRAAAVRTNRAPAGLLHYDHLLDDHLAVHLEPVEVHTRGYLA